MLGNFFVKKNGSVWFKVHGSIFANAMPVLVIENLTTGTFTYEVESSDVRDGTLSTVMTPVAVTPLGKHKIEVPVLGAGVSPANTPWCKLTVTLATEEGLVAKVTLHGPDGVIVEVPSIEQG